MSDTDNFEQASASSPAAVAEFDDHRQGLLGRFQHLLHENPALVPLIVLVASVAIFGVLLGSKFFSPFALTLILQQVQIVGVLAAAQSLIILTAGIDLSVGAIAVMSSVIMGQASFRYGLPPAVAIALGLVVGTLFGAVNGWLVAKVKLPPFIVTLGTWQIILAANYIYSANETIRSQDIEADAPLLHWFGGKANREILEVVSPGFDSRANENAFLGALYQTNFTYGVIFMVLLFFVLAYALKHTAWGRHVYAVGDDPEAAELAGVDVKKTLISVYAVAGLICAFAGWVMIGRFGSVSPSATTGVIGNIQSITAVVIGGISLFGGRGSIMGALFGALIVGVYELGLRMYGADPQWTFLLIGVLIIAATTVDQWIRKVSG